MEGSHLKGVVHSSSKGLPARAHTKALDMNGGIPVFIVRRGGMAAGKYRAGANAWSSFCGTGIIGSSAKNAKPDSAPKFS
jgi:hypothetical protein